MKTFSKTPGTERVEYITCPVCGSSRERHRLLYDYGSYSFRKCINCSLVLQNPQPVFDDLSGRYDSSYFRYEIENEEPFYNLMMLALNDIGFDGLDFHDCGGKKILDVGCATGRLLQEFKSMGWETAGVEICAPAAEYGRTRRGVDILPCRLEEASFRDRSFTVIHASHLIEHLNNPVSFLDEVYRILVDEGYLVLVTPNIRSFQGIFFGSSWRSAIADHLFLYSDKTLEKLCVNRGFSLLRKKTWGGLAAGLAPRCLKRIMDKAAKKYGFGDVMVTLFKKTVLPLPSDPDFSQNLSYY